MSGIMSLVRFITSTLAGVGLSFILFETNIVISIDYIYISYWLCNQIQLTISFKRTFSLKFVF